MRRKSSTFVDAIHDMPETGELAPAQLYSTESGRLFHSGRIAIATVGLPARGKTHLSVALARYLRWLGVKTRVFHLGDYRRQHVGDGKDVPDDYFFVNASPSTVLLRQKILKKCRDEMVHFLNHENGQVAVYDAVNAIAEARRSLAREFAKHEVETLFIESACDDENIIEENVRSVKISSPDYIGWDSKIAIKHYLARMSAKIPHFETMEESDLNYVKMFNAGERITVNNCTFGYLSHRMYVSSDLSSNIQTLEGLLRINPALHCCSIIWCFSESCFYHSFSLPDMQDVLSKHIYYYSTERFKTNAS